MAIFLIVSFPVASSSVINFRIFGQDEIDGFVKGSNDLVSFEIEIDSIANVTTNQIEIAQPFYDEKFRFNNLNIFYYSSCERLTSTPEILFPHLCKANSNLNFGNHDFLTFNLNFRDHSLSKTVYSDYRRPEIRKSELYQQDGKLYLDFEFRDLGSNSRPNNCVGLYKFVISNDAGFSYTHELSHSCLQSGKIEIPFTQDGTYNFNLRVYDRFNHLRTKNINNVLLDFTDPIIDNTFSFKINGEDVEHISSQRRIGDLHILIDEPNIKEVKLKGNYGNEDKIINECEFKGDKYECVFRDIGISLTEENTLAEFEIYVKDLKGNEASKTITKQFIPAFSPPKINFIGTTGYYERLNKSFISNGQNTFLIEFENVLTQINKEDVKINLGNLGGNNLQADNCYEENNLWKCEWKRNLNNLGQRSYTISISSARDIVGNSFTGITSANIEAELQGPTLSNISSYSVYEGHFIEYHKTGDNVFIFANVSSGSGIKNASGNFRTINHNGSNELKRATCEYEEGDYLCAWNIENVRAAYEVKLDLFFYDYAGNELRTDYEITIYNPTDDEPDCYEIEIGTIMPVELLTMRGLSGIYYQTVPFNLKSKCYRSEAISIQLEGSCSYGGRINYVEYDCDNSKCYRGFFHFPIVPRSFVDAYDLGSNLSIGADQEMTCYFGFNTITNRNIYPVREYEEVAFEIPITSQLTPPDEKIKYKVDSILDRNDRWYNKIGRLDQYIHYLTTICGLMNVLRVVNDALSTINIIVGAIDDGFRAVPVLGWIASFLFKLVQGTLSGVSYGLSWVFDKAGSVIGFMCSWVMCDNRGFSEENIQSAIDSSAEGWSSSLSYEDQQRLREAHRSDDHTVSREAYAMTQELQSSGGGQQGLQNISSAWNDVRNAGKAISEIDIFPGGFLPLIYSVLNLISVSFTSIPGVSEISNARKDSDLDLLRNSGELFLPGSPLELAKSNVFVAYAGLCLPAVVHHANKQREMDCWRALCYLQLVEAGYPAHLCEEDYQYQLCLYRHGWITVLLRNFGIEMFFNTIINTITNPSLWIWFGVRKSTQYLCDAFGNQSTLIAAFTCVPTLIMSAIEQTLTAYSTIRSFKKGFKFDDLGGYCNQLDDLIEVHPSWLEEEGDYDE